jgi:predicted DCC family thiol-disulfide oxidoreductase YuxK
MRNKQSKGLENQTSTGPKESKRYPKTKILVDGNCLICDAEIAHYKKLAPDLFEIVDISSPEFDATQFGLSPHDVNKNMHALTPQGEIKVGVDAFAHIWSRLAHYRFAANIIQWPAVYQLAKVGYSAFTLIRPYLPKRHR